VSPLKFRVKTDSAVSPIVAVMLLLAITVVLTSVLYVMITNLLPTTSQNPVSVAADVTKYQTNWSIRIVHTATTLGTSAVYLSLSYPNGTILLQPTPLSTIIPEFHDTDPQGILSPGDFILLSIDTYPEGSKFMLMDGKNILFYGELR